MSLHDCVCDICWLLSTACALNFNVIGQKGTPCLTKWDVTCCDKANAKDVKSIACEVSRIDKACAVHNIVESDK